MPKSKPWMRQEGDIFFCDRCKGVSVFKEGVRVPSTRIGVQDVELTYWNWRKGFKKAHVRCRNANG